MKTRATGDRYGAVKLTNESDKSGASRISTANPYRRENVNVAQGPRVGTEGAHSSKRAAFHAAKEERAPLATVIENAYSARQKNDYAGKDFKNDGSIEPNVKPRKFKSATAK